MPNFHVCKVFNDRACDLQDPSGLVRCASIADTQLWMPAKYIVSVLPDIQVYGWASKYINDPSLMSDLKWKIIV